MPHPNKKGVGLNPSSLTHYIDHLAVVCILMDIPLLFIDEADYQLGKKYYPGLKAEMQEYSEFNPEYLITHYDVLFLSDLWDRRTFHEKYGPLEKKYKKLLRHVHCPHGFSDKGFYLQKCGNEDIVLVYGQNMLDLLQHCGVLENMYSYVISGNYRFSNFKKNRKFYDDVIQNEIANRFEKQQTTLLYAPTWLDLEESTTFFDAYADLLGKLPAEYNMIVKLHPRLELDDTAKYYQIIGKYEDKPNILFLKDFPPVYPLLAYADIYIGDTSSIGYDFLAFNKPMFFLNKYKRNSKTDRSLFLFQCGVEIMPEQYSQIYKIIENNLSQDKKKYSEVRKNIYHYTFGEERAFADIKNDIIRAYNTEERFPPKMPSKNTQGVS